MNSYKIKNFLKFFIRRNKKFKKENLFEKEIKINLIKNYFLKIIL